MSQHILAQAAGEHQSHIETQQAALQSVLQRVQALRDAAGVRPHGVQERHP